MTLDNMVELRQTLLRQKLVDGKLLNRIINEIGVADPQKLVEVLQQRSLLTSYQVERLRAAEPTGLNIGPYRILYLISAGAFGEVFRAVDHTSGAAVALKVLRDEFRCDDETVRSFYREAELIKNFDHPHIAKLLSFGLDEESNRHYIALEFIEGGSLRSFMRVRGKIEPPEMMRMAIEMIDGLRYALEQGVTHRDIKATNILLSATGEVKWIDFGLGGKVLPNGSFSVEQRTIDYAGLEKATGATEGDPQSDIFFIGLIFFEMIAGFKGIDEPENKADRVRRSRFKEVRTLGNNNRYPAPLTAIIDRMTRYSPADRYASYDSLLRDLKDAKVQIDREISGIEPEPEPPRVMIVHRSPKTRDLLKIKLPELGYQAVLMENLERAMTIFKLKPADCLVIDLDSVRREEVADCVKVVAAAGTSSILFLVNDGQKDWIPRGSGCKMAAVKKPLQLGPFYLGLKKLKSPGRTTRPIENAKSSDAG